MQRPQDRRFKAIEGSAAKSQFEAITPLADAIPLGNGYFSLCGSNTAGWG